MLSVLLERTDDTLGSLGASSSLRFEPLADQGWMNFTFAVTVRGQRYIVRMHPKSACVDAERWSRFHREAWAMGAARSVGVPVPGVPELATGSLIVGRDSKAPFDEVSYFIQERAPHTPAPRVADVDRDRLLRDIGAIAAVINQTPTVGFGDRFDAIRRRFQFDTWTEYVDELIRQADVERPSTVRVLGTPLVARARARLEGLKAHDVTPRLFHQDFAYNWANVLLDDSGRIGAVIDWEFCGSGPAMEFEVASTIYGMVRDGYDESRVAREIGLFLEGYGVAARAYEPTYTTFVEPLLVHYGLVALRKYDEAVARGQLSREPWRKLFARRARGLLIRLLASERSSAH